MKSKAKIPCWDILGWILIGLSVIMLGKSLMLCFSSDIWYDELFTVGMIEHSYGDLIALTARDVHPPLYYCIVKLIVELCKLLVPEANIVALTKIISVLPYFILLVYSVTFIRKRFGILTGGLFLFCVIAMPQLSAYTVEIRMYSWALLFVTAAYLHTYGIMTCLREEMSDIGDESHKILVKRKVQSHYIALVLYGLAAAYTQYFACVAVIMVYLWLLLWLIFCAPQDKDTKILKKLQGWFVCVLVSVVGYFPWLLSLYRQMSTVRENYWILPLTWRTLGGCVKFIMKPSFANDTLNTILAVVLFLVYIAILWNIMSKLYLNRRVLRDEESKKPYSVDLDIFGLMLAGAGVLAGMVLFGFVASFLFRPIFVYRYMIPALGCFWFSFALGAVYTPESAHTPAVVRTSELTHADKKGSFVTLAICAFILVIGLRDYRTFIWEEKYKILQMKDTMAALNEIGEDDILIFNFDQVQMVVGYYMDNDSYLWYGQPETLVQEICGDKGALNEDTAQIGEWISQGRKVWFIGSFNSREDIIEEWRASGFTVEETGSVLLERYWFNLYKIS